MVRTLSILFFFFLSLSASAQEETGLKVTLKSTIPGEIKDFTTDNLGNIYLLTAGNQIKKVNEKGDSLAVYNDVRRYGKIYSVDATNPLKVLVYFKDFSTIVVLDRLLNVRNVIDLRKQDIYGVRAITSSYDNNIWLFDELAGKIKKLDNNGTVLTESADFRQVFDPAPVADLLYDRDGQLFLYDNQKGVMVFDYYGAKKTGYQIKGLSDLQVIDKNTITARDSSSIYLYKPATLQTFIYKPFKQQKEFIKINFTGNRIYCLKSTGEIEIYSVIG